MESTDANGICCPTQSVEIDRYLAETALSVGEEMHFDLGECPRWTLLDVLVTCARIIKSQEVKNKKLGKKTEFKKLIERNRGKKKKSIFTGYCSTTQHVALIGS